jgi:PAS domain S-box-containing protein
MPAAALRNDEAASLAALHALQVLDGPPHVEFDALTQAAALLCDVPISLVSLMDADRQWFLSNQGLPSITQTPRDLAFCAHAVLGAELLEVPDATQDPRFADNALVTGEPDIRFYAGAPVRLSNGACVGTLCVIDRQPRELDQRQRQVLQHLALAVSHALEGRLAVNTANRAVQALAASESRFRSLCESSPLGVFATDPTGACTYTNPRWEQIFGLTAKAALGAGWTSTLHPLHRDHVLSTWARCAAQGDECNLAFRIQRPDGSVREVHSRARAVTGDDGSVLGHVGSVDDVTDRHRIEGFLERTGRVAGVGGWEVDLRTQVTTWSEQTRRIHEVPPTYQPDLASAIEFYAEESRPELAAAVQACIEQGKSFDLELPFVTARGRRIWVRAQGDVLFEGGRAMLLTGTLQDVTEQRRRWLDLQQEQALRGELEQQMQQTQRLLRERGEMLDVMAHEVRQPLNNASAAMQGAVRALAELGDHAATPRLQRAQSVLAQVLGSIDNTLAVAALLARPDPIERLDVEVDTLLQVALADLPQPQRARIVIDRATLTRTASMDLSLMRLALRNLLTNALKFSSVGSPVVLHVADCDEPLALLIDVANQGEPIASERVPGLFERGSRPAPARAGQGMGLGLYIVRRVMELHGGSAQLVANDAGGVVLRLVLSQPMGD